MVVPEQFHFPDHAGLLSLSSPPVFAISRSPLTHSHTLIHTHHTLSLGLCSRCATPEAAGSSCEEDSLVSAGQ